ncbi:MAG: toll/interleukin-1 receptor domain-containing protein [Pseudomonadota bacterium]
MAFAGPDRARAEAPVEALGPDLRVFWDGLLTPGQPFDTSLGAALDASRVVAVLLSRSTEGAWYQRAEIARAIHLARAQPEQHRVVPVLLEEVGQYGLGHLVPLRANAADMGPVAAGLRRLFPEMAQEAGRLRCEGAVPPTHRDALRRYLDWVLSRTARTVAPSVCVMLSPSHRHARLPTPNTASASCTGWSWIHPPSRRRYP